MAFHAYDIFAAMTAPEVEQGPGCGRWWRRRQRLSVPTDRRPVTEARFTSLHPRADQCGDSEGCPVWHRSTSRLEFGKDRSRATIFEPRDDRSYSSEGYAHWSPRVDKKL